jgi:uncharacterized protein
MDAIIPSSEQELPLFPLNIVLFPGGVLPLHIFEQRYRLMIQSCLDNQSPFGVVLIREGEEVGAPAEPYSVGTAVHIVEAERFEDGRMNLLTSGQYRFEIREIQQRRPYLVGKVHVPNLVDIESGEDLEPVAEEAVQLYQDYETILDKLIFAWEPAEQIPAMPRMLAYQIGTRLQISLDEKQQLLEMFPIHQLLRREIAILKRENQRLRFQLAARNN